MLSPKNLEQMFEEREVGRGFLNELEIRRYDTGQVLMIWPNKREVSWWEGEDNYVQEQDVVSVLELHPKLGSSGQRVQLVDEIETEDEFFIYNQWDSIDQQFFELGLRWLSSQGVMVTPKDGFGHYIYGEEIEELKAFTAFVCNCFLGSRVESVFPPKLEMVFDMKKAAKRLSRKKLLISHEDFVLHRGLIAKIPGVNDGRRFYPTMNISFYSPECLFGFSRGDPFIGGVMPSRANSMFYVPYRLKDNNLENFYYTNFFSQSNIKILEKDPDALYFKIDEDFMRVLEGLAPLPLKLLRF